jgi:hypothetical protein
VGSDDRGAGAADAGQRPVANHQNRTLEPATTGRAGALENPASLESAHKVGSEQVVSVMV